VPAPQYVHAEFGFVSPRRFRRRSLWVVLALLLAGAGIGAAVTTPPGARVSDAAVAPAGQITAAETIPISSPVGFVAVNQQTAVINGTRVVADKPFCVGGRPSDGDCVSFQPPKVRMVRVPRVASIGQQGNSAKSGLAANSRATELDKGIAETKKAQRSAHRQNQRRNQPLSSASGRREARGADWKARGYAPSDYGRQGFSRNFW
jgi:hypothetical protein